ncbi:MAG: transcriptional regulator of arginine metabolism [Chloroflexota bacterium]|nr:transcriptional regulator of arginine metabolism [Chloroflexota bacterium]
MTARPVRAGAVTAQRTRVPGKAERQQAILDLVGGRAIRTQEELVAGLRGRGLEVTQATVSRDLRELGLARVAGGEGLRYIAPVAEAEGSANARLHSVLREHVRGMEFVGVLGVLRTRPSTAPLVAAAIDGARFDEVAGTVAGDDTVLVVARGAQPAAELRTRLQSMLGRRGVSPAAGAHMAGGLPPALP